MTQLEVLEKALELIKANPEMPVRFCAAYDEYVEDCKWTAMELTEVEIVDWYDNKCGYVYMDEDEIRDELGNERFENGMTEEECERLIDDAYDKEVHKVICIFSQPAGEIR